MYNYGYKIFEPNTVETSNSWITASKMSLSNITNNLGKLEIANMEYLYKVYVVDNKKNIIIDEVIVAKNEDEAKFDLRVDETIREKGLKLSDVTIITQNLGAVKVGLEKA